jgi:undecaprenyl diphosphate synthase
MSSLEGISCIGFIMDGNRRWAAAHGKPSLEGHKEGTETFTTIARAIRDRRIPHAVFFAFSTENWKRSDEEVAYLMSLFGDALDDAERRLNDDSERKVRLRFIGRREDFTRELQERMQQIEERSESLANTATTIWVALSYGGRAEIIAAVNAAIATGTPVEEATFNELLWSTELPDLDIIVRTSGEQRISNFMTWKSVYSELFFTDTYWPAFTVDELDRILDEYAQRHRRHGT